MRWLDSMRCWNSCNTGCSSLVLWLASLVRLVSHVVRISSVVCLLGLWLRKLKTVDIIFTTVKEQICTVHTP
ncbi:hypothetical protein BDV30DRAFT_221387 [Aspergillus minisclerotigenes]|uniref:Uncharacterized protein n=1 Tax=Aspergillus minisclerotigenes TaxID=656917 RepID=A0A5N6IKL3_9EURO|nr:hypothetical protein BDV30DRAFT_221387 [Aspergillus minisclerotigenes]